MKKNSLLHFLFAALLALVLVGCQANDKADPKKTEEPKQEQKAEKGKYTVKDDLGKEITFDKVPEKVVSLMPSNTEILFALGVGNKIVGATEYDTYPEEAKKIERVSDSMKINPEKIIALKPDVVIGYTMGDANAYKPLEDAGVKVFVIKSALSFDDVYSDITQIAEVMGAEAKGKELNDKIKADIKAVQDKVAKVDAKKKVYFEISPAPEIYTTGSKTFQQEILNAANVENVYADQENWIKVSEEDVIKRNPAAIITSAGTAEEIKGRAGWNKIEAVQKGAITVVDPDVTSRPGPRIAEAVKLVAKAIYPDQFK